MATYRQGINGPFFGKVGRVIGSINRGKIYIRGVGDIRVDNPTPAQLASRARLVLIQVFLMSLKSVIELGFPQTRIQLTAMNQALSINLKQAVESINGEPIILYDKITLSKGSLAPAYKAFISAPGEAQLKFSWDIYPMSNPSDAVTVVAYCPGIEKYCKLLKIASRADQELVWDLPSAFVNHEMYGWIIFSNGNTISNSMYLGKTIIL